MPETSVGNRDGWVRTIREGGRSGEMSVFSGVPHGGALFRPAPVSGQTGRSHDHESHSNRPQTSDPSLVRPAFAFRVRILLLACVALLAWFPARAAEPLDASFTPIGNFPRSDCRQGRRGYHGVSPPPAGGLLVLDVSTPSAPVLLGSVALGGDAVNLYAVGTTVYVAQQSTGLRVVDASNPSAPVVVGTFNTSGLAQKVWVSGSIAYVADGPSGIHVLDVSNPSDIRRLGVSEPRLRR